MFRKNFFYAMVQIRWFIRKSRLAKWASIRYTDDHILDYMEVDASHAIFEVEVPEEWTGKTVGGLDIRKRYNINILAVKNEGEFNNCNFSGYVFGRE